ncbi:MAG: hypothetical protein E7294_15740 [Lachnospiraceae bacterium]|nr:hypothetical protein [Lachnospiraceae bacterium]
MVKKWPFPVAFFDRLMQIGEEHYGCVFNHDIGIFAIKAYDEEKIYLYLQENLRVKNAGENDHDTKI